MSTPAESASFVIEIVAGSAIAIAAGWMVFLTSCIKRIEKELDEHKIESERRLTTLEEHNRSKNDV